jgi:quercetin dioxygenase-like cupin family protein
LDFVVFLKSDTMEEQRYAARFASMDWESTAPKVRRKLHQVADRQLRVVEFGRGLEHPEWCQTGHIGYVLQGELRLEFEGGTLEIGPGDGFVIPDGEASRHRPVPLTDRVLLILSEQVPQ